MTTPAAVPMTLDRDGAELFAGLARPLLAGLGTLFEHHPPTAAGTRLFNCQPLRDLLAHAPIADLATTLLGNCARPVRAILFNKTLDANWGLGWHQDRVIAVRRRVDVAGFGAWSVKRGVTHVAPPWPILAALHTLRIHLDRVDDTNAPLLVAPGSHRVGIIPESDIDARVDRHGIRACHAAAGDVWAYSTPILHASAPSLGNARRRVLQLDYAANDLPEGLEWYGV